MTTSRPTVSTHVDHEAWEAQRRAREEERLLRGDPPEKYPKFGGDRHMPDNRLTSILGVFGTVIGGLAVLLIYNGASAFISVDKNVALLLARPIPVSKEQYDQDMEILRTEQRNMRAQLETIQNRQQAAISKAL